jgi:hypothetical protein
MSGIFELVPEPLAGNSGAGFFGMLFAAGV